jgi:hypothetical protein
MKALLLTMILLLSAGWALAESNQYQPQQLPEGYPKTGQIGEITEIDTDKYQIRVNGRRISVYRAVEVFTTDHDRIFLFQIPLGSGAVLIKDDKGMVVEIWLLPNTYEVPKA